MKKVLLIIVIILAIPFVASLFIDGNYAVEREIEINKPVDEVFNYVKYLKNQDNFSVWSKMDPNMTKDFKGSDGQIGAIASWNSKLDSVGVGEQEIKKITNNERIDFELRFKKPFEATDNAYFITKSLGNNKTNIKWGFNGKMNWPMNLMMLFMDMEKQIAPDLENGLTNLKTLLESVPSPSKLDISVVNVVSQPILYISDSTKIQSDAIAKKLGDAYGEMMALIGIAKLETNGSPFAVTNKFSLKEMFYSFDAAIPVKDTKGIIPDGRIKIGKSYEGKVVKAVHIGSYESSAVDYNKIIKYIKDNNLTIVGRSWEEYIDDPTKVDQDKLRTNIYFPVK